jgi:hypothetical protein
MDINIVQTNKVDTFTELQQMLDLGFAEADEAYKAAQALLSQNPRPTSFKVGKRVANVAQLDTATIDTVVNDTLYSATINGTLFTYTSDASAVDTEIRDGLVAAINGGAEPVTAAPGASNTYTLTADVAGDGFSLVVDTNQSFVVTTPNLSIVTELADMQAVDDNFYFVLSTSRTSQDILALAQQVETLIKIYGFDTDEADSKDLSPLTDTTSIFGQLKALNLDRTFGVWSDDLDNYPVAAWVGEGAPKDPGSITWKFKNVQGVSASVLTITESNNIRTTDVNVGKNANTYEEVGGVDIFTEGTVFSGEFIDIIRGTDWIQVRMQENVFATLIAEDKIPFTNKGIKQVQAGVDEIGQQAIDQSILQSFESTAPDVADTSSADRANRVLKTISFSGQYAGAIHKIEIAGTLSV